MNQIYKLLAECDRQIASHQTMSHEEWERGEWLREYNDLFVEVGLITPYDEDYLLKATEIESLQHLKDCLTKSVAA